MSEQAQHSPLPWRLQNGSIVDAGDHAVVGFDHDDPCYDDHGANKDFIVKAVNHHHALVEALRSTVATAIASGLVAGDQDEPYYGKLRAHLETLGAANKLLAKVEGQ